MNTYNTQQLNDMTKAELLKMAKQCIHPDKVAAADVTEATELFKSLNSMNKQGLIDVLTMYYNNELFNSDSVYFDEVDASDAIVAQLSELKQSGKTRKQALGWLSFEHGIDGKPATALINRVYPRSGSGASKADIVTFIIHSVNTGATNKVTTERLCKRFNFAPSTGKTIMSHLSYMVEYAKQVNNT